jgi:hypothetical protein
VAESIALARALGRRPRIVFLGVHASRVSVGEDLSPPVMAALPRLVAMIRLEVERALGRATVEGSRLNRPVVVP